MGIPPPSVHSHFASTQWPIAHFHHRRGMHSWCKHGLGTPFAPLSRPFAPGHVPSVYLSWWGLASPSPHSWCCAWSMAWLCITISTDPHEVFQRKYLHVCLVPCQVVCHESVAICCLMAPHIHVDPHLAGWMFGYLGLWGRHVTVCEFSLASSNEM